MALGAADAAVGAASGAACPADGAAAAESERTYAAGLVDRVRETAALRRAVDDVAAGNSGCVLVEGPAGIGKTRLLAETRRLAERQGVRVFTARGSQLEKEYGFGAVRQLFEATVGQGTAALAGGAAAAVPIVPV